MIRISLDDRELRRSMKELSDRKIRWAAKKALDATAADVLAGVKVQIRTVFDRPVKFTQGAFIAKNAHTSTLEAEVLETPKAGARDYLKVQEFGGRRGRTNIEDLLDAKLAYDGIITAVTPAGGAKLDAYGNWSRGERNQALSAVQAQRDSSTNTTKEARKRKRKRAGFFVPKAESKLSAGIWKRAPDGSISKVLHFTRTMPVYDRRFGLFDGVEKSWKTSLPEHLRREMVKAVEEVAARRLKIGAGPSQ